ncbi:MAG: sigma-70 family RNA polymerase sigma factor [Gemmatimonadales bacterium]
MNHQTSGPAPTVPTELSALVAATRDPAREDAWAGFVHAYTSQILRVARSLGGGEDAVMDRYAFVLQSLRDDDCHRLRAYLRPVAPEFGAWLTVVVRRLCLDHHRQRYGRASEATGNVSSDRNRAGRRRLVDLVADRLDPSELAASPRSSPDVALAHAERARALTGAVERLRASDRLLLRLRFTEELSVREIARLMRFPTIFHVYRRLNTVCDALRQSLRAVGVLDAEP